MARKKKQPPSVPVANAEFNRAAYFVFAYVPPGGVCDYDLISHELAVRDLQGKMLVRTYGNPTRRFPRRPPTREH